ncbi:unnamed protein product [Allacma fusca]|uniref:Uncharacterized protein n=1 Tax=Allacma fusca TaxID=39272 RepID=A0A8J2LGF8_9HEXA|nr:unnamed protein product [Allacma fusca]
MHFLEPPRVVRSSSQEEFVVEEEVDPSSRRNSNISHSIEFAVTPPPDSKPWKYPPRKNSEISLVMDHPAKLCALGLFILCVILGIACTVLTVFYMDTIPPYEVCRTRECTRSATLFLQHMDDTVDPCDDFPRFACGNWITDTATVTSLGSYDHTTIMRDRIIGRLRHLVENLTNYDIEPLRQVKFIYDTCTDTTAIEEAGLTPLNDLLERLIKPGVSLAKTLARIKRETGQSYVFSFSLSSDYRNTAMNAIFIDQPELPVDSSIFSDDSDTGPAYRKLMNKAFEYLMKTPGVHPIISRNSKNGSVAIMNLEQQFANTMSDLSTTSKAAMFNLFSLRELNRIYESAMNNGQDSRGRLQKPAAKVEKFRGVAFNWTEYVKELYDGIPGVSINDNTHVIVNDIAYVKNLSLILANTTKEEIDLYLAWEIIYSFGKEVSRDFRGLFYDFTQLLDGSETSPSRKTECINLMDNNIAFALTYRYILKYVPDEIIEEANEMVQNLLRAFKDILNSLDWMDSFTKYRARLKADKMRAFMGYPKWLKNETALIYYYSGLYMSNFSFFGNILVMKNWLTAKELKTVNLPVDTTWSSDSPAEADAFYDDELNAITFPSGFLQEPFFGMGLRSIDYGALGAVIGHEITHGFDTRGRYSDENGRLQSWWSIPTLMQFVRKAQCFVNQYNNYRIPELEDLMGDKNHLNGKKTLAENIADNGGVREALAAYRYYVESKGEPEPRLPGLEKYSPEQLFFLSFAQSWCSYNNPSSLMDSILTNEHSPARFRIIGPLTNSVEFSKVWQCNASSFMNPPNKCVLW